MANELTRSILLKCERMNRMVETIIIIIIKIKFDKRNNNKITKYEYVKSEASHV